MKWEPLQCYLDDLNNLIQDFDLDEMMNIIDTFQKTRENQKRIFVLGNGGSSAHANHFACDLGKNVTPNEENRFQIISVCESVESITAYANDINYQSVFAGQLKNYRLQEGDVVFAISSSGNSPNVIMACEYAKEKGCTILSLTGFSGGKLKQISNHSLHIPCNQYEKVEDLHMMALHMIVSNFKYQNDVRSS